MLENCMLHILEFSTANIGVQIRTVALASSLLRATRGRCHLPSLGSPSGRSWSAAAASVGWLAAEPHNRPRSHSPPSSLSLLPPYSLSSSLPTATTSPSSVLGTQGLDPGCRCARWGRPVWTSTPPLGSPPVEAAVPSWLCWPLVWLCGSVGLVPPVKSAVPLWLSSDGGLARASILVGLVLLDGAAVVGGSVGVRWISGRCDGGDLHGGRCCAFHGRKGGRLAAWRASSVASLVEGAECGSVYLSEVRNLSSLTMTVLQEVGRGLVLLGGRSNHRW
jgi:hypothetical protein